VLRQSHDLSTFNVVLRLKNILFWAFLLLAVAGGVYAYLALKKSKRPSLDALAVLPDSCSVYLHTANFFEFNDRIRTKSIIADKLRQFAEIDELLTRINDYDSLLASGEIVKELLSDNPLHFALYEKPSGWLLSINLKQLGSQQEVAEALAKVLSARQQENGLFAYTLKGNQAWFSINAGVLVAGNNQALLALAQDNGRKKFIHSKAYKAFLPTLEESGQLSLLVNHSLISKKKKASAFNANAFVTKGFTAAQLDLEASELKINGYLSPDSLEFITALANEEGQSPRELLSVLPHNVVAFTAFGFGSFQHVKRKAGVNTAENEAFWKAASDTAMYNLEKEFTANAANHLISFETASRQTFVALQVQDTVKALEHMAFMSDSCFRGNTAKLFTLRGVSGKPALFKPLLEQKLTCAAVFGTFILFSDNRSDLMNLLGTLGQELLAGNNESFARYSRQNFPDEYNYLYYVSPGNNRNNAQAMFGLKSNSTTDPYSGLKHFSFSLINDAMAFRLRMHLQNEAGTEQNQPSLLWSLALDTTCSMKPCAFVNHNTGENELLVQDDANSLYLINAKGAVLWKRSLEEKIISEIVKVDVYKNDKYQMLFNTRNHIFLLDRNGKDVKGFPVDLPAEATSPLCLIDYDNDKDYRIFIACADRRIYNYNPHGMAQEGFVPVKTEHAVDLPLQYVKVGKSDYLVALDAEGKIYTFSRKGVARIGLKNRSLAACPAYFVDATNNIGTTNFICVDDKSGLINKISFADQRELVKLNMESSSAGILFCLIDDNRDMDVLMSNGNSLQAFNFNGDLLFEKNFGVALGKSAYYSDESLSMYLAMNKEGDKLLVYNVGTQKTKLYDAGALPLVSNLFKDNKKYLITTKGRQLNCFPVD